MKERGLMYMHDALVPYWRIVEFRKQACDPSPVVNDIYMGHLDGEPIYSLNLLDDSFERPFQFASKIEKDLQSFKLWYKTNGIDDKLKTTMGML